MSRSLGKVGNFEIETDDFITPNPHSELYGTVVLKGQYREGKMDGLVRKYHDDVLINTTEYNLGVKHGESLDYRILKKKQFLCGMSIFKDGEKIYSSYVGYGSYGAKDGHWLKSYWTKEEYSRYGQENNLSETKIYVVDRAKLNLKTLPPGKLVIHRQYKVNKLHGKVCIHPENGELERNCNFWEGQKHGMQEYYYQSGNLKLREFYIKGKRISSKQFEDT